MLTHLMHWSGQKDWIYKTRTDWEEELGLSRWEQETARKKLKELGLISERKKGIPPRLYFSLTEKFKKMVDFHMEVFPPNEGRYNLQSYGWKTSKAMDGKPPYNSLSTHKNTTKTTATAALRPVAEATFLKGRTGRLVQEYFDWATKKHYLQGKRKPNLQEWKNSLIELKRSHSDSLDHIEEVLNWYYTTKDPYHPRCHHLTTFCQRFEDIQRAYCRDTGTPLPSDEDDSPKVTKNILPPRVMTYEDVQAEAD